MMKCLVIDEMHESITSLFHAIGIEVDYKPSITHEEILAQIKIMMG